MRYEEFEGITHVYVGKDETEQEVLRAIVKASFELARPASPGDNQEMTDKVANSFINLSYDHRDSGYIVVEMDYAQGRQCETYIEKISQGHFILWDHVYTKNRGTPEPMFDRANNILDGKKKSVLSKKEENL